MKFSVLIPTRNRLKYLKYAVETVLRQNYSDWELIISDNDSEDNIADYVNYLNDSRVKYFRTKQFVPVTDNWNNALKKSSGDYVIMLGDDDGLMRGCFSIINKMVMEFGEPDFIYTNALLYAYPGVMPNEPGGFLQLYSYAKFFTNTTVPFWLDKKNARRMFNQSLNFRMPYTYNMQHSVINMKLIKLMQNGKEFFQSPYPDYYATNALMLIANKILICPYPIVAIGISPKSFGYYYFNDKENQGVEFLNNKLSYYANEITKKILLPGSSDRSSWLLAMQSLKNDYEKIYSIKVNYRRYRYLQIRSFLSIYTKNYGRSTNGRNLINDLAELTDKLSLCEKLLYLYPLKIVYGLIKHLPVAVKNILKSPPLIKSLKIMDEHNNIIDVFESTDPMICVNDLRKKHERLSNN